jgi:hypothetical protein
MVRQSVRDEPRYAGRGRYVQNFPRFPRAAFIGFSGGGFYSCPTCRGAKGPQCWDLITQPAIAFSDKAHWPPHFNDRLMRETVERWARSFVWAGTFDFEPGSIPKRGEPSYGHRPQGGELALWCWQHSWPIILGKQALARAIDAGEFPPDSAPQRLLNLMPFDGDEYGALICSTRFETTTVEFFALAVPVYGDSASPIDFHGGPARFRIVGPQPDSPHVRKFVDNARRWWAPSGGQDIRSGRPAGTTKRSLQWYLDRYRELASELHADPTRDQFCQHWQVDLHTLRKNLNSFGVWPWEKFKARAKQARTVRR